MGRDIPEELQPPALLPIRAGLSGCVDHAPDADLDYGKGAQGVHHQGPCSMRYQILFAGGFLFTIFLVQNLYFDF